jgi:adenine-specific DNA-methyltransferase
MVTNNEVSDVENKSLTQQGYRPGDDEWNALGIARYVTWSRTSCSIRGVDIKGNSLKGTYAGSDIPISEGFKSNAIFFKLGFLDKNAVALGRQFKELVPVLWMKAGAIGECPVLEEDNPGLLVLPKNKFAILADERRYLEFVEELEKYPEIETVYIVTDSERAYRDMISFMDGKNTYQLYRDYLDNFRINSVRR